MTARRKPRSRNRRQIWFNLHLWIGWAAALPILAICLTGIALAFEHEIYQWEQPEFYALPPEQDRLSLPEILQIYEAAHPRIHLNYLDVPDSPDRAYLAFASEINEDGQRTRPLRAYVNPYSGALTREYENPTWIRKIEVWHRTLGMETAGRWIIAISSSLLAITSVVGIILWWPTRGRTFVRALLRRRPLDWHNAFGLLTLLPLLILSLTGITFTWGKWAWPVLDKLQGSPSHTLAPEIPASADTETNPDHWVRLSDLSRSIQAEYPESRIIGVQSSLSATRPYRFHLKQSGDIHPGGSLKLFYNPVSGDLLSESRTGDLGPIGWYRRYFYILHTG
ncbi:MAG: PepSY-associated TM helix domain-containing protein, partial [Puniceicoccales bacterium]